MTEEIIKNLQFIKDLTGITQLLVFIYFFGKNIVLPLIIKLIDFLIEKDKSINDLTAELNQKPCLQQKSEVKHD